MRLFLDKLVKMYPRSLLSEFYRMFGLVHTEKLLAVFAGTTLQIPSTKDIEHALRDISIWETLRRSKSPGESRRLSIHLAQQHQITHKRVRTIYYSMVRLLKENTKFTEADKLTGQHKLGKVKVRRKNRMNL